MTHPTFIEFWSELFLKPKLFFKKYLPSSTEKMPYSILAFMIYGIGNGIDRLDGRMTKMDIQGKFSALEAVNNWPSYWIIAILGGLVGSFILYFIAGWFYNLRIKWSKGLSDIKKSRRIFLYSAVTFFAYLVVMTLISMILNDKPYQIEGGFSLYDQISIILILFFAFYSIYVSYCGALSMEGVDKFRAKIWFLILPTLFYIVVYAGVFILVFTSV